MNHVGSLHKCTQQMKLNKKVKVKQSHHRPEQAHRVPGGWSSQISRQLAHEGGKVVSNYPLPAFTSQEIFLVLTYVRSWVSPRSIVQLEGLCQWKILVTLSGIKPVTFWLAAQRLNQLRHHIPQMKLNTFNKTVQHYTCTLVHFFQMTAKGQLMFSLNI
jgi:hypothetical protein